MSAQVEPNLKPDLTECPCGCGVVDRPRVKAWADGLHHARSCRCRRCQGGRNRRGGLRKQSTARKRLGVPASKFGDANEERWVDALFANEVKAGKQVGPVANWWRRVEGQVLAARAEHGDRRLPVRAVAMPMDWGSDGLVVMRLSTFDELVRPALDAAYGGAG